MIWGYLCFWKHPYQLPDPFCIFPSFPSVPSLFHRALRGSGNQGEPEAMWFKKPIRFFTINGPVGLQIPPHTFQTKSHTLHCRNKQEKHEKTLESLPKSNQNTQILTSFANSSPCFLGLLSSLTSSINLCKTCNCLVAFLVLGDGNTTRMAKPFTKQYHRRKKIETLHSWTSHQKQALENKAWFCYNTMELAFRIWHSISWGAMRLQGGSQA